MSTRLSLPHEHGGILTAAGATLVAAGLGTAPAVGFAVGLAVVATFLARGPIDRLSARLPLRVWDRPALLLLGLVALAGIAAAGATRGAPWAAATGLSCAAMLVASALARRARAHRATLFEVLGMAGLGASAGLGALVAGAPLGLAAAAAIVVAAHASVAVPLVRTELRRRERVLERRALVVATVALAGAAALVVLVGQPAATLALVPRALHLGARAIFRPAPARPAVVGWRETLLLALCVSLLVIV